MAAGSSAPELFVAVVGVFVTHDPVGVGACLGCAQRITKFVHYSSFLFKYISMRILRHCCVCAFSWWCEQQQCSIRCASLVAPL